MFLNVEALIWCRLVLMDSKYEVRTDDTSDRGDISKAIAANWPAKHLRGVARVHRLGIYDLSNLTGCTCAPGQLTSVLGSPCLA